MIDVNLYGYFLCAQAAARAMVERKSGCIVQINSKSGKKGSFRNSAYAASKFGGIGLTQSIALDLAPHGVRVNALAPGVVRTPMAYVDREHFDDMIDDVAARHPLRRIGEPDDLAGPAVFLLGDDSRWMTGASLVVDGGYTIQ